MPQSSSDDFQQLALLFIDPIQYDYEVLRDLFLYAETVAARSAATGVDRATINEKDKRFVEHGMLGLADHRSTKSGRKPHQYPEQVAAYLLYCKQLYPPVHDRELVRIVQRKFGYHTNHHTVRRFLRQHGIGVQLPFEFATFHQYADAYRALDGGAAVCRGVACPKHPGLLKLSRQHVWNIVTAFAQDGFAGLEDRRTRPATHPGNQLSLPFLKSVLDTQQEFPKAGRFRIGGVLSKRTGTEPPSEATVGRAIALNRQHHGASMAWSTDRPPQDDDGILKSLPYLPTQRHLFWFIDLRYLRTFDGEWVYSVCVLEGYSRKLLAGMASEYQDEVAVLQLLAAALGEYGCPRAIVSDNGSVFTADAYCSLLETLGVEPVYIEKGKPWENLIEAQFKIQLRLGDAAFDRATSFDELQNQHAAFVDLFNTTPHWAHRDRADGRRTPAEVLGWVRARPVVPDELRSVLRHLQIERSVRPNGYISVQKFYIYAERGVARHRVSVWLYEGRLQVMYRDALLARYNYRYDRKRKQVRSITDPQVFHTPYASPQLELWELDESQWRKVLERPIPRRRKQGAVSAEQLPLSLVDIAMLVLFLFIGAAYENWRLAR